MTAEPDICDSCKTPLPNLRFCRRGKVKVCPCCSGWVRMSLRRTRKVPKWIRIDPKLSKEAVAEMKEQFSNLADFHGVGRWAARHTIFEMGFPYYGPLNDRAWGHALAALNLRTIDSKKQLPNLRQTEIAEELSRLEKAGVLHLPSNAQMRKHLAHIMRGDFGRANKRRFASAVFIWLVGGDEFIARDPDAWAVSFGFLREVVDELDERASFIDDTIRVIGSSGNIYRIRPRIHPPYYIVYREVEDRREPICIDPIGAHTVLFADVLVNLVLSLYDDTMSARHITTLHRHVFGHRQHPRRVNRNIDHLWRQALGNVPPGEENPNEALPIVWRQLLDRFQTNLADWTDMEDDEDDD